MVMTFSKCVTLLHNKLWVVSSSNLYLWWPDVVQIHSQGLSGITRGPEACVHFIHVVVNCCRRLEVLRALLLLLKFWDVMLCWLVKSYRCLVEHARSFPIVFSLCRTNVYVSNMYVCSRTVIVFCRKSLYWLVVIIYLNINQLDALNFIMSLVHSSACFEHMCSSSGGQNCTIQPLVSLHWNKWVV